LYIVWIRVCYQWVSVLYLLRSGKLY
jgi:hypothetical protein